MGMTVVEEITHKSLQLITFVVASSPDMSYNDKILNIVLWYVAKIE